MFSCLVKLVSLLLICWFLPLPPTTTPQHPAPPGIFCSKSSYMEQCSPCSLCFMRFLSLFWATFVNWVCFPLQVNLSDVVGGVCLDFDPKVVIKFTRFCRKCSPLHSYHTSGCRTHFQVVRTVVHPSLKNNFLLFWHCKRNKKSHNNEDTVLWDIIEYINKSFLMASWPLSFTIFS